jgi:hypothetical protein
MATATLHPNTSLPVVERAPALAKASPTELPPFWSSLSKPRTEPVEPQPVKSSALVGDLWIQIR